MCMDTKTWDKHKQVDKQMLEGEDSSDQEMTFNNNDNDANDSTHLITEPKEE